MHPAALQGNTIEINNFIQDTPTSCVIEAYVDPSRQFEAAWARATITITPTVVEFVGQSLDSFDPGAGTAAVTVTLNREWDILANASCGYPDAEPYRGASSYTVTFTLTTIPTPEIPCTLSIDTDSPDGAFTPDSVEFTIP